MIADLASIATLILFVFYFIGRIITIFNNEKIYTDLITIESKDFYDDSMQIVEEWDLEEDYYNKVFLTTTEGIIDIQLFEYQYDSEMNKIGETLIKEVFKCGTYFRDSNNHTRDMCEIQVDVYNTRL